MRRKRQLFAPFPIRNEVMRHICDVVALGFLLSFSHAKNLKRIHSGPEYSVTIMRVSIKREEMISIKSDIQRYDAVKWHQYREQ